MNITRTCPPVEIIIFYTPITIRYTPVAAGNPDDSFASALLPTITGSPPQPNHPATKTSGQNIFPGKSITFAQTSDDMTTDTPAIRKRSLAEELAARLQEEIAAGIFGIGEKLPPEPELMRIFGVGRSTVREAVRILSDLGLLRVRQGAGTFVVSRNAPDLMAQRLKRADIRELDEVRRILEAAIVEKAAERYTEQDAFRMKAYLSERKEAAETGRLEPCIDADVNFHAAIAEATHNEILSELYRATAIHLRDGFKHIYADTGYLLASQPSHDRLAAFILAHDTRNALKTIRIILEEP